MKLFVLIVVGAISLFVLASTTIPLGVPGEWTWDRRALLDIDPVAMTLAVLLAGGYWWGASRLIDREESSTPVSRGRPLGPCLLALFWLGGLLLAFPEYHGIGRSPTVLYYKRTEGYFWQAAFEVQDPRQFLATYRDSISKGDDPDRYLHLGTHPPGLTLAYRGMLALMESSPGLARAAVSLEPPAIRDAFDALRQFPTPGGGSLSEAHEATLWAAALVTLLAAAGAAWPIYRLTERMSDRTAACRAALLWPLVPSLLVFFPKSDLLCPVIATTSCWLWLDGWSRQRWVLCLLSGIGFFVGLMLTLALAPVALLLVVQTCLERWSHAVNSSPDCSSGSENSASLRNDLICVACAVIGLAIPLAVVSLWGQCNIVGIWIENLRNHAMFYDHNSRSYWLWLAVNPVEAALALGAPLACLIGLGIGQALARRREQSIAFSQTAAWLLVWSILWLSGKNMGEAARLWIFLAPWPVMTAANAMRLSPVKLRVWLGLQLSICIVTVVVIDGFHFAELLGQR